jgi:hypothetical protein
MPDELGGPPDLIGRPHPGDRFAGDERPTHYTVLPVASAQKSGFDELGESAPPGNTKDAPLSPHHSPAAGCEARSWRAAARPGSADPGLRPGREGKWRRIA